MSLRWVFISVLLVLVPFFAFSETETVKQQLNAIDPWLDGYMDAHLEAYWIPGAAVAVVTDERSIIRGYGFRDPIAETPVDPQHTMFRIASITKTFLVFGFTMFWIPFAPLIGCRSCDKPRRKARRLVRFIIWLLSFVGIPGVAIVIWFVLFGEGYLFEDPVTTRILTFSNSLVFVVLGFLVITTALTRRYHPLGSESIPFLTRAIIGVGFFYTFLVLWWNLVPWKMV